MKTSNKKLQKLNMSYCLQKVLYYFLDKIENTLDYLEAKRRYKEFIKSGEKAIPLAQIKKRYGIS